MTDFRLLALETVNDEAVLLRERIADLEGERDTYQEMLRETLRHLNAVLDRDRQQRDRIARLADENRRLRVSRMTEAA